MAQTKEDHTKPEPRRPLLAGGELLKERGTRPPGGRTPVNPFAAKAHERLAPQARTLIAETGSLPETLRGRHVVVEATLYANFLANSHFPADTIARHRLYVVGERAARAPYQTASTYEESAATKSLLLAGDLQDINALANAVVDGPDKTSLKWPEVARLHVLGLPAQDRVLRLGNRHVQAGTFMTWEAVLTPIGRSAAELSIWNDEAFGKLQALVTQAGGEVDIAFRREVAGVTYVPLWLDLAGAQHVARFNLMRALRPMPKLRPLPDPKMRTLFAQAVTPGPDNVPVSAVKFGIFDGGIAQGCAALSNFARQIDVTTEPPDDRCVQHGSMTTGAFLYGHLSSHRNLPRPRAYVDHFRVLPVPKLPVPGALPHCDHDLIWIADRMFDEVAKGRYPAVNVSLGPDECVSDDDTPHYWTAKLDQATKSFGTLFIFAAGNNGEDDVSLGLNRVLVPSDMANGLSVGACTMPEGATTKDLVKRASYSPVGPARDGQRIAPFGVQFGGDPAGGQFGGIDHRGRFHLDCGTSFAAPLVSRGIAELAGSLDVSRWSPATARSFAAHFAVRRRGHKTIELGHGRLPQTYQHFWECLPNECTVLYQDALVRGVPVMMMLPFPQGIDDEIPIEVEWTIAHDAEVSPLSAVEYTLDGIELTYRPNERMRRLKDPVTDEEIDCLDIERDRERMRAIAQRRSFITGDTPVSESSRRSGSRAETWLREAGKWGTILREAVPARPAMNIFRPRIEINYLRREFGALVSADVSPLPITMLVTLRAPVGTAFYDLVEQQFDKLSPLANFLKVSDVG